MGTQVEHALDHALLDLLDPDQGGGGRVPGRPDVLDHLLEVEMAVLGVDHDPVVAEGRGDLADRWGFEGDPHADRGLAPRQLLLQDVLTLEHDAPHPGRPGRFTTFAPSGDRVTGRAVGGGYASPRRARTPSGRGVTSGDDHQPRRRGPRLPPGEIQRIQATTTRKLAAHPIVVETLPRADLASIPRGGYSPRRANGVSSRTCPLFGISRRDEGCFRRAPSEIRPFDRTFHAYFSLDAGEPSVSNAP